MVDFDFTAFQTDLVRLGLALLFGAIIGAERQLAGQSAGLRTHIMVSVGSAIFVLAGLSSITTEFHDVTRVIQGVTAGIGFLGAGTIIKTKSGQHVHGLTTASSIWLAAAMGTAAGLGEYALAASSACIGICVLVIMKPLSRWLKPAINRRRSTDD